MKALVNAVLDRGLFEYQFKPAEIAFAVLQGASAYVVTVLIAPVGWTSWESFGVAAAGAGARAAAVVIFGKQPTAPVGGQ